MGADSEDSGQGLSLKRFWGLVGILGPFPDHEIHTCLENLPMGQEQNIFSLQKYIRSQAEVLSKWLEDDGGSERANKTQTTSEIYGGVYEGLCRIAVYGKPSA